jgi:hypothetical protein
MAEKRTTSNDGTTDKLHIEEVVEDLIVRCMDALENKQLKVTVTNLIRLRTKREELAPTKPRGEAIWVDRWD